MLNNYYFSYYSVDSTIHKMNPTAKIITLVLTIITLFFNNYKPILLIGILLVALIILSKIPIKNYLKIVYSFRYIFMIIIIICAITKISLISCVLIIAKIIILLEEIMLLTYTTSPIEIANGVENVLKPFNILFIKTGKMTMKIMLAIKFIPVLLSNADKVFKSQSSRGYDYEYKTMFGKLIVIIKSTPHIYQLSLIQIRQIKLNMLLKMYNGNKIRTNLNKNKIGIFDFIIISINIANILINIIGI